MSTPEAVLKVVRIITLHACINVMKNVPLSAEIDYINNYFSLEKLRYNQDVRIEFNTQFTSNLHVEIAPFYFTPFWKMQLNMGSTNVLRFCLHRM